MSKEVLNRKLAGIFSADARDYSLLMAEDEVATIRTLTDFRELMATLIQMHRGRVVDSPGDNLLSITDHRKPLISNGSPTLVWFNQAIPFNLTCPISGIMCVNPAPKSKEYIIKEKQFRN